MVVVAKAVVAAVVGSKVFSGFEIIILIIFYLIYIFFPDKLGFEPPILR